MTSCRIEPLTSPSQIDDILAIEEASFSSPWTREMYLAELNNTGVSYFYLARTLAGDPGEVIGFCSFWHVLEELHINNLAVLPAYRRSRLRNTSERPIRRCLRHRLVPRPRPVRDLLWFAARDGIRAAR